MCAKCEYKYERILTMYEVNLSSVTKASKTANPLPADNNTGANNPDAVIDGGKQSQTAVEISGAAQKEIKVPDAVEFADIDFDANPDAIDFLRQDYPNLQVSKNQEGKAKLSFSNDKYEYTICNNETLVKNKQTGQMQLIYKSNTRNTDGLHIINYNSKGIPESYQRFDLEGKNGGEIEILNHDDIAKGLRPTLTGLTGMKLTDSPEYLGHNVDVDFAGGVNEKSNDCKDEILYDSANNKIGTKHVEIKENVYSNQAGHIDNKQTTIKDINGNITSFTNSLSVGNDDKVSLTNNYQNGKLTSIEAKSEMNLPSYKMNFKYDSSGNLKSGTLYGGYYGENTLEFDSNNRVTKIYYKEPGMADTEYEINISYDKDGNIVMDENNEYKAQYYLNWQTKSDISEKRTTEFGQYIDSYLDKMFKPFE